MTWEPTWVFPVPGGPWTARAEPSRESTAARMGAVKPSLATAGSGAPPARVGGRRSSRSRTGAGNAAAASTVPGLTPSSRVVTSTANSRRASLMLFEFSGPEGATAMGWVLVAVGVLGKDLGHLERGRAVRVGVGGRRGRSWRAQPARAGFRACHCQRGGVGWVVEQVDVLVGALQL